MHGGNLSFFPYAPDTGLCPAPAYDMLPMRYAPLPGGEVTTPAFPLNLPTPPQPRGLVPGMSGEPLFWSCAAADARLSAPFRAICRKNEERLQEIAGEI
ncbi:MAG: hypothetical protein LBS89_01955 [Zoogloeaceae bacterium]|jgi:hypothetical protein|nr:hypothetical protein [Zoogloeaceae bacterium]